MCKTYKVLAIIFAISSTVNCGFSSENKSHWQITNDFMMIIGKYFETTQDFVNVMKVNKRYKSLAEMYKFNPVSDISLFPNSQTQHFYEETDEQYRQKGMYQYIYWNQKAYEQYCKKANNEIYKSVILFGDEQDDGNFVINDEECIVPEGVTELYELCFCDDIFSTNYEFGRITLPRTLKKIGVQAFYETCFLEITIPEGVRVISSGCFEASNLKKIILPSSLQKIEAGAFSESPLESIDIPDSVISIEEDCFYECGQLKTIQLPAHLLPALEAINHKRVEITFDITSNKVQTSIDVNAYELININWVVRLIERLKKYGIEHVIKSIMIVGEYSPPE